MKKHTSKQYARALFEATVGLSGRTGEVAADALVARVTRDGRLSILPRIAEDFANIAEKKEGKSPMLVITRFGLDNKTKKAIGRVFGEGTPIKEATDEGQIGGIVVRAGDTMYNASIKTQIELLYESLAK